MDRDGSFDLSGRCSNFVTTMQTAARRLIWLRPRSLRWPPYLYSDPGSKHVAAIGQYATDVRIRDPAYYPSHDPPHPHDYPSRRMCSALSQRRQEKSTAWAVESPVLWESASAPAVTTNHGAWPAVARMVPKPRFVPSAFSAQNHG
jgi:hypothetical protein